MFTLFALFSLTFIGCENPDCSADCANVGEVDTVDGSTSCEDCPTGDDTSTPPLQTTQFVVDVTKLGTPEPCDVNGDNGVTVDAGTAFELTDGVPIEFTIGSLEDLSDNGTPLHDSPTDDYPWASRPFSAEFDAEQDVVTVILDNKEDEPITVERNADDGMFHITRPLGFYYWARSQCEVSTYEADESAPDMVGAYISGPTVDDDVLDIQTERGYLLGDSEEDAMRHVLWMPGNYRLEIDGLTATFVEMWQDGDHSYVVTAAELGLTESGRQFMQVTIVWYDDWEAIAAFVGTCTEE